MALFLYLDVDHRLYYIWMELQGLESEANVEVLQTCTPANGQQGGRLHWLQKEVKAYERMTLLFT